MAKLPDPLDMNYETSSKRAHLPAKRILSDRGIKQAMNLGLIKTIPSFDPDKDTERIQPATLDVKISEVEESELPQGEGMVWPSTITLPARSVSEVSLSERIDFGQFDKKRGLTKPSYLNIMTEARSSLRRLGAYMPNWGAYFYSPGQSHIEIGNFSRNDLHLNAGERIAQAFFRVNPFADYEMTSIRRLNAEPLRSGEKIRSLEMGIEITENEQLRELERRGYMEIKPGLICKRGMIVVHASETAFRMKLVEGGINFSQRDKYSKEDLLEPLDISKGYKVQPFEHILVEVREKMILSPHVGIEFLDNLVQDVVEDFRNSYDVKRDIGRAMTNIPLIGLPDGWVDPGYSGMFSRQPKWLTGRTIHPGDPIGLGQVFYFPKGVENPYGSERLGSQYNKRQSIAFSKKQELKTA